MTRRIRDDLVGVVHVPGQFGVTLKAGDEVPEGVEFGDHLFDAPESGESEQPAGNASTEAWQEFARSRGAADDDLAGKTRDELRETYGN